MAVSQDNVAHKVVLDLMDGEQVQLVQLVVWHRQLYDEEMGVVPRMNAVEMLKEY